MTGHPTLLKAILAFCSGGRVYANYCPTRGGAQPLAEIATDLGYQHAFAFSRSFRRWTGVSPRAYRKSNRAHADLI